MKKYICMSFFLILFSQCSATKNSEEIFLKNFQGTWKTSPRTQPWFANLTPPVTITPDIVVEVAVNGTFTVAGITFTFVEIEANGILAVYEFIHDTKRVFTGIGFGQQNDVLIIPSVGTADQVVSTDKGEIFLIK